MAAVQYFEFHYGKFPDQGFMDLEKHPIIPPDQRAKRLTFDEWRTLKTSVHQASGEICAYCGDDASRFAICDHVIPLSRGGTNDRDNLVTACDPCNSLKGMLTKDEFLIKKGSRK